MAYLFKRIRSLAAGGKKKKNESKMSKLPFDYAYNFPSTAKNSQKSTLNETLEVEKPDYRAINNYSKVGSDEITLFKNDLLVLIKNNYSDFALVKNIRTKKIGFVPISCIDEIDDLEQKDWFYPNISRSDAIRLLEYLDNELGTFLIRIPQDVEPGSEHAYTLSYLDLDEVKKRHTKNYKIMRTPNGELYITSKKFKNLNELIRYFRSSSNGLTRKITKICPKEEIFAGFPIWEEKRNNIKQLKEIGSGNYGKVYKGLWRNKHDIAIKTLRCNESDKQKALEEAQLMKNLKHDKIVKLYCVCSYGEPFLIVMEFMCNGSLNKWLRYGDGKNYVFNDIIHVACQIANGMEYLAKHFYVHRDLAARNILVGERNSVKISDFGLAINKLYNITYTSGKQLLAIKWSAPELYTEYDGKDSAIKNSTEKSDVWSFGVVLYELITLGAEPYKDISNQEVMVLVKYEKYRLPNPAPDGMCTKEYYDLMKSCWDDDPQRRPTFTQIFKKLNENIGEYSLSNF